MTLFEGRLRERPTEGRVILGGGFTEPRWAVKAAAKRMQIPGASEIVPVSLDWAMKNPEKFATMLDGARYLGNSANTLALVEARKHSRNPASLGLKEAVIVAGVEERSYPQLTGGYGLLIDHQAGAVWTERHTPEGRANAGLVLAKLGSVAARPWQLARLGAIHSTSSMEVLTSLAKEGDVPGVAAYVEGDEFGFAAPEALIEKFVRLGGIAMKLPKIGHEGILSNPERAIPQLYPDASGSSINQ